MNPMIRFLPMNCEVEARDGETLLQAAQRINLPLHSACGGKRVCGKCKVVIEKSENGLPPPSDREVRALGDLISKGYRLACETRVRGSAEVRIPEESRFRGDVILTSHTADPHPVSLRPGLELFHVHVPLPELHRLTADRERLLLALEESHRLRLRKMDPFVLRRLPQTLRSGEQGLTAVVRGRCEIVDLRPGREIELYGMAFDIGTTTVVGYLLDLQTGKEVTVQSALNPQTAFGADVITRIAHGRENPDGLDQLSTGIVGCLNQIVEESCHAAGIRPEEILEATAVGNTVMHHLFVGLDPGYVAQAPFSPVLERRQDMKARDLGLKIGPSAYVHLPPLKAGFVGSDTIACILATRIHKQKPRTLLIDLGTNGEIVYGNRERLLCCSTAAGPAFEGGHIRWGMRAAEGAIDRVRVDPATLEVEISTIGHSRPVGLCGSGIISAAAELIRRGVLLRLGRLTREIRSPRIRQGKEGWEFVLAWAGDTDVQEDIVLTQKDFSELLMAKAAVHAGASLLIEMLGAGPPEKILVAGACGNAIDPEDAAEIDLFPESDAARLVGVGNAAGNGASLVLLDHHKRREAERVARKMEYQELAASPRFKEFFVSGLFFPKSVDYKKDF